MNQAILSNQNAAFTGSIPAEYEQRLGPILFADFAAVMAERAARYKPARVLELAAGTGIVTREMRNRLDPAVEIVATDLNAGMLELAARKFTPGEAVTFQTADAMTLPFADDAFPLVICQFGVMFFPDLEASLRETRRVLQPGGKYLFSVWDSHALNPFARIAHTVAGGFFPEDPPTFYLVPFSLHSIDPIKSALSDAGFTDIAIHVDSMHKRVPSAADFARGLIYGNPLATQIEERAAVHPDSVVDAVAEALRSEFGPDPITVPLQTIAYDARARS